MARIEMPTEHLTDYERAICYYTIPKVTQPLTFGLIIAYVVCLMEAVILLLYGIAKDDDFLTTLGTWALAGIVLLGVVAFMVRAFMNEMKQRRALAVAKGVPDAIADLGNIPDPFADHVLLRHPLQARGDLFPCTDNTGTLTYFVESSPSSPWWKVKDPHDNEVIRVHIESAGGSFLLSEAFPARLAVYEGAELVARLRRRFSLSAPTILIECYRPKPMTYLFSREGIYRDKRLVGRIFYLHHSLYLDVEQDEFHNAILALFVVMT
jgi:hypothetical protein